MTHRRLFASTLLVLALAATACGSGGSAARSVEDRIEVSGELGKRPRLDVETPLEVTRTQSWTEKTGAGDRVGPEATTILHLTILNGRTGETAISTFAKGQQPLEAALGDQLFPSLSQALVGKRADSRVVLASTADDAYGEGGSPQIGIEGGDPVVVVADILSTDPTTVLDGPTGSEVATRKAAPVLEERSGLPVGFDFAGKRKPRKLTAYTLREGTGPPVESPDRIAADYLGQVWGASEPFEETFSSEPSTFSIGLSNVIKAWDTALAGQKEGARVLVVCPPRLAYGAAAKPGIPANSTLVFVVDVLGVG